MAADPSTGRRADSLPVVGRHAVLLPVESSGWFVSVACPAGAPVFAVVAGRVASVRSVDAGELVLRSTTDAARVHYRRLSPGSAEVRQGDLVEVGQLLGRAARTPSNRSVRGVLLGVQADDGTWLDPVRFLTGAADPGMVMRPEPTGQEQRHPPAGHTWPDGEVAPTRPPTRRGLRSGRPVAASGERSAARDVPPLPPSPYLRPGEGRSPVTGSAEITAEYPTVVARDAPGVAPEIPADPPTVRMAPPSADADGDLPTVRMATSADPEILVDPPTVRMALDPPTRPMTPPTPDRDGQSESGDGAGDDAAGGPHGEATIEAARTLVSRRTRPSGR